MTRNGKIARLPVAIREELNQRPLNGEQGKQVVQWLDRLPQAQSVLKAKFQAIPISEHNLSQWNKQRIRQILGLGKGYDGAKNPEWTRPPALRGDPVQASTAPDGSKSA